MSLEEPDNRDESTDAVGGSDEGAIDDGRLIDAVRRFSEAQASGTRLSRQELLAAHPEIAADLSACLQGLSFLDSAAAELGRKATDSARLAGHGADSELLPTEPLGDFRLVKEIGRGGMGVVYEAIQLSLGRRVAVKVLPLASSLDPRQLQRFRTEAQAAAQLHHNNIVPVYAVGSDRSVHFYAMQLIEGRTLAEVIRELRALSHPPADDAGAGHPPSTHLARGVSEPATLLRSRRSGYFRFVAQLGVQAARALQYAHDVGIVHRDIKPGNLMLDDRSNLWVTDFGLAQVYAETDQTRTGDAPGTLRYMSPEQAAGKSSVLDQRTDIYSLGATLYELLTLCPAVSETARSAMIEQITRIEPAAPRSIFRDIPLELETILGKAMAKEADDRYLTAAALADDLERFLRDEPIQARPPTIADRAAKWVKRHRQIALTVIATLSFLSIALAAATILLARAERRTASANALERAHAAEAHEQRLLAEHNFDDARTAVDFMTSIATADMPANPEMMAIRRRLLQSSLDYYQKFLDSGQSDDRALAAARARVGALLTQLHESDELGRMNLRYWLAEQADVQSELGLTQKQVASIVSADSGSSGGMFPLFMFGAGSESPAAVADATADFTAREKRLKETLTTAQWERLLQISRQLRGVSAFRDPDVEGALALTAPQRAAVLAFEARIQAAVGPRHGPGQDGGGPGGVHGGPDGPGGGPGNDRGPNGFGRRSGRGPRERDIFDPGRQRLEEARVAAMQEMLAALDAHQLATWRALIGPLSNYRFGPMQNRTAPGEQGEPGGPNVPGSPNVPLGPGGEADPGGNAPPFGQP